MTTRRTILQGLTAGALLAPFLAIERAAAAVASAPEDIATAKEAANVAHQKLMAVPGLKMHGDEQVAILMYPGFTALDLVGPHYFFACMMGATVHLVTTEDDLSPVPSDLGLAIAPTIRMQDVPTELDILFAPGGTAGTVTTMKNEAAMAWLADRARHARFVTSVCTGSLLLGKAGLLNGRRATSHWAGMDVLPLFGATAIDERVVTDGNVITGAGVSAGLDFGLAVVAALRGRPYAEALMLQAEYAPEPPFPGGTIAATDPAIAGPMVGMFAGTIAEFKAGATG
ncbi:MAG: DJ-1/PfpI family protein [Pacificimonas sp.]